MSQGRADKPVVWSETVPSIVPLSTDLGRKFMCIFAGTGFLLPQDDIF